MEKGKAFLFAKVHPFEDFSEKSRDSKFSELIYVRRFILFLFCPRSFFGSVLGLHRCMWVFSSRSEWGLLPSCSARAPHCGGLSRCGAQA